MSDKKLRILLADERHEQLLHIEKQLNRLDYYRIAPIRTFDELMLLTSNATQTFDLLIVNKTLGVPHGIDMQQFCRARPHIRHVLIYGSPEPSLELVLHSADQSLRACSAVPPDVDSLSLLMSLIDQPVQWAGIKALSWLRGSARQAR
ncbi:hypothetical protein [Pseudomonas sp. RIT288]|jgi:hypothetical protein|uniref:hypothetical protein n=1 Tax=Pseudomonas sp. RIT288 TaxID=1470589 RepID=UPI0004537A9F|nr:hypothetical protein [Pseudomonas sp. RIT288]EZP32981.1 response regulator receiver protein [Pseudomonas sp. RIT288]